MTERMYEYKVYWFNIALLRMSTWVVIELI